MRQAAHTLPLAEALAGGLRTLEITLRWLSHLLRRERPRLCVGVGIGLDRQMQVGANAAGMQFVVSPVSRFRRPGVLILCCRSSP